MRKTLLRLGRYHPKKNVDLIHNKMLLTGISHIHQTPSLVQTHSPDYNVSLDIYTHLYRQKTR